jgi:PKHD-type hydroxylase
MNPIGHFIQPPVRKHMASHYQYTGKNAVFSAAEVDWLHSYAEKLTFGDAAIGNPDQSRVDDSYRAAEIALIPYAPAVNWLYQKINSLVQWANDADYRFELSGLLEPFQFIRYTMPEKDGEQPGHYHWHQDFGADYMSRRKLSVVVQLSHPTEYEGCRLTIMDPGPRELTGAYQERGAGVIFPSYSPHMVTPLLSGTRCVLVAWIHGTPFR